MKIPKVYLIAFLFTISSAGLAQTRPADSLKSLLKTAKNDTLKVNTLNILSGSLVRTDAKEALLYANQAKELADKLGFERGQAYALKSIGMGYYFQGNYIETLLYWQQSLETFQSIGDRLGIANMLNNLEQSTSMREMMKRPFNIILNRLRYRRKLVISSGSQPPW